LGNLLIKEEKKMTLKVETRSKGASAGSPKANYRTHLQEEKKASSLNNKYLFF
jgi:hypothetical protein